MQIRFARFKIQDWAAMKAMDVVRKEEDDRLFAAIDQAGNEGRFCGWDEKTHGAVAQLDSARVS